MILCEFVTGFGLEPFASAVIPIPRIESWVTINGDRYWVEHTEIHLATDKDNPIVKCECKVQWRSQDVIKSLDNLLGQIWVIADGSNPELLMHYWQGVMITEYKYKFFRINYQGMETQAKMLMFYNSKVAAEKDEHAMRQLGELSRKTQIRQLHLVMEAKA